jgi:hypothetical protein
MTIDVRTGRQRVAFCLLHRNDLMCIVRSPTSPRHAMAHGLLISYIYYVCLIFLRPYKIGSPVRAHRWNTPMHGPYASYPNQERVKHPDPLVPGPKTRQTNIPGPEIK